jgi:hypothetical protein
MIPFYLSDPVELREAEELMLLMGDDAGDEAAARADRGRDLGNHIAFCRWRQIGRLIDYLSQPAVIGTLH